MDKIHLPNWLLVLLSVVLILRIPSFFEPFWYGDETIYLSLGEAVRQGVTLYQGIHDNKPPLLYILGALAGNVFWFKVILAFWNLITIVFFWKLTSILFPKKEKLQQLGTVIFGILTAIPLLEGNVVNAELFMIGPIILAFWLFFSKKHSLTNLFLIGILFSISVLFKVPSVFDLGALFFLLLFEVKGGEISEFAKKNFFILLGLLTPIFLTFIWFWAKGSLNEYISAAFLQNVGYLSSWRPSDVQKPFLERNLPLLIRGGIVALGVLTLYWRRKVVSREFLFVSLWILFSLFGVTLSERPYPHYLIQALAPASILLAMLFTEKTLEQSLAIIPLALFFATPLYFKFWYYPTLSYYERFVKFAVKVDSKEEYFTSFSKNTVRNYQLAGFLGSVTARREKVFIWGGEAPVIYALSRRLPPVKYVVDYHINDYSSQGEVVRELSLNKPRFIVILPESGNMEGISTLLRESYFQISAVDDAEIWKLRNFDLK